MAEDVVRVMRVVVYEGPRSWVETTLQRAIKGTRIVSAPGSPDVCKITAATLSEFPEVVAAHEAANAEEAANASLG